MHGQTSKESKQEQHRMRPVPCQPPAIGTSSNLSKCFSKDGRRINIGDCALFQAGNAPPFIGIIRDLANDKEGNSKVVVNWLYRPADIRLVKGVPVDAAPNEVFYSFHRDEISGISLLHPCKVAFLRKGIELPPGVSSFVCRRVYDFATKHLWWLTDRDYIDDHQEEVDQLLDSTKKEMQATGSPSPRSLVGSTSSHHPNMTSEAVQNVSLPSAGKRKRERIDHSSESSKREQSMKTDDTDISHPKRERFVKPSEEIACITNKDGGLLNLTSVDQLVRLMQQECNNSGKKGSEVSRRIMLSGVVAATEKEECLDQFVQLGGLPLLNDWLQEAHKGKDGGCPKEGDKGCEELLMTLLQALDRLPIDLDALKKCIVGKSVNNLRSHRNIEIQKKARKLVDTWRKRVDAEMKMSSDLKALPNPAPKVPAMDIAHNSQTKLATASEVTLKTTKTVTNGSNMEDSAVKFVSDSVCGGKPQTSTLSIKDQNLKAYASVCAEISVAGVKEERSSSAIQSHSNTGPTKESLSTSKEEGKSSCAAKLTSVMMSNSISPVKGHSNFIAAQKELVAGKFPCSKAAASQERVSCSGLEKESSENVRTDNANNQNGSPENIKTDNVNNQRVIVRLPNPVRSQVFTTSGGSTADSVAFSKGSLTSLPDEKVNMLTSSQINSCVEASTGVQSPRKSDLGSGHDKESLLSDNPVDHSEHKAVGAEHILKRADGKKGLFTVEGSTSLDNCPTGSTTSTGDCNEIGIDLLASVAVKESSVSEEYNTDTSTGRSIAKTAEGKINLLAGSDQLMVRQNTGNLEEIPFDEGEKERHDGSGIYCTILGRGCSILEEGATDGQCTIPSSAGTISLTKTENDNKTPKGKRIVTEVTEALPSVERGSTRAEDLDGPMNIIENGDPMNKEDLISTAIEENPSNTDERCQQQVEANTDIENTNYIEGNVEDAEAPDISGTLAPTVVPRAADVACKNSGELDQQQAVKEAEQSEHFSGPSEQEIVPTGKTEESETNSKVAETSRSIKVEKPCNEFPVPGNLDDSEEILIDRRQNMIVKKEYGAVQGKEFAQMPEIISNENRMTVKDSILPKSVSSCQVGKKTDEHVISEQPIEITSEVCADKMIEVEAAAKNSSDVQQVVVSEFSSRPLFDLNEGILPEEPFLVPLITSVGPPQPSLVSVSLAMSSSLAAPIAVVAATKGLFIPPSDSLVRKAELGWKGSAATSAFRPAEPRRILERSQCPAEFPVSNLRNELKRAQHFEFDLNTVDEKVLEDVEAESFQRSSLTLDVQPFSLCYSSQPIAPCATVMQGLSDTNSLATRLELDLNQADGTPENAAPLGTDVQSAKIAKTSSHLAHDFDLNDGPSLDSAGGNETVSWPSYKNFVMSTLPAFSGLRTNQEPIAAAWFPASQFLSKPEIPTFPAVRVEPSYPIVDTVSGNNFFKGVSTAKLFMQGTGTLMPSPVVSYVTSTQADLSYTDFTLQSSLPLAPTSFTNSKAQYLDPTGSTPSAALPSHLSGSDLSRYGRPYVMDIAATSDNSSAGWHRPNLDLNAGPELADLDGREEGTMASRHAHGFGQGLFQHPGVAVSAAKRKEPEGGLDPFRPDRSCGNNYP